MGVDSLDRLETPRHSGCLLKYGGAYLVPETYDMTDIDQMNGFIEDGKVYCLAGSELWFQLVEDEVLELADEDLEEPIISRYGWLYDFYVIVNNLKSKEKIASVRPLASCWYHICTQISLEEDEEEEEGLDLSFLSQLAQLKIGEQNTPSSLMGAIIGEVSDESGTQQEVKNEQTNLISLLLDSVNMENEEDDEDDEYVPQSDEEDEEIEEDEENDDLGNENDIDEIGIEAPESEEELTQTVELFKETVLQAVEHISAYLPDNPQWLQRAMTGFAGADPSWYPWGFPPKDKLLKVQTDDESEKKYISQVIQLLEEQK